MANTRRKALKRRWAQGKNHLEKAAIEMLYLKEVFEPTHPDYARLCEYNLTGIFMVISGWDAFARNAWGTLPNETIDWMK